MNRARKTALAAIRASISVLVGLLTLRFVRITPSRDLPSDAMVVIVTQTK